MVTRTFLSKSNTIVKGSRENLGLNPISVLTYGKRISRCLLYFETENIKNLIEDNGYNATDLKHVLKMTNCGSIDFFTKFKNYERTSSFNVILCRMPLLWDEGVGFDETGDYWITGKKSYSENGSNWYQAYNGLNWSGINNQSGQTCTEGVFSNEYIEEQYIKFLNGEESIVIGDQHFDHGNENLSIDITSYVNSCLDGQINSGLLLVFDPMLERMQNENIQYVGFFNGHTNTVFAPVVETRMSVDYGRDCSGDFKFKKANRIFLDVDQPLDVIPECSVSFDGDFSVSAKPEVHKVNSYRYFVDIQVTTSDKLVYLKWSNIIVDSFQMDDIEQDITVKPNSVQAGKSTTPQRFDPSICWINDNADMVQGEKRMVGVEFNVPYTSEHAYPEYAYYKIYVKDAKKDVDIIEWDNIDITHPTSKFTINTGELLPNKYYVDIKIVNNGEISIFRDILHFFVVSNETELKR